MASAVGARVKSAEPGCKAGGVARGEAAVSRSPEGTATSIAGTRLGGMAQPPHGPVGYLAVGLVASGVPQPRSLGALVVGASRAYDGDDVGDSEGRATPAWSAPPTVLATVGHTPRQATAALALLAVASEASNIETLGVSATMDLGVAFAAAVTILVPGADTSAVNTPSAGGVRLPRRLTERPSSLPTSTNGDSGGRAEGLVPPRNCGGETRTGDASGSAGGVTIPLTAAAAAAAKEGVVRLAGEAA